MNDTQRFEFDRTGERQVTRLRRWAALLSLLGAAVIAMVEAPWPVRLLAIAAGVFGLLWLREVERRGIRSRQAGPEGVSVGPEGIELRSAGSHRCLPWPQIARVTLDEDALQIEVTPKQGEPMRLEAGYRDAGIYDVFEAIRAHGDRAGLPGCAAPKHG